ncbi:MAG: murein peptide amidase A [Magnetococcales bacterium]|nr:murein peptide amidase A [Magnetococcales bacterium]MBF0439167.1 murein peptide amidase A [Magnetococcales bacterium]
MAPLPRTGLAEDPSNLSSQDAMEEIVLDTFKENIIPKPTKKTEKKYSGISVAEMCNKISSKLNSIKREECLGQNLQLTNGQSVNGLPILMKEYPPQPNRPPQARILLLGGIHGDEYSSISIVFKWMETLNAHHSGLFHWRIAPLVNPDGLLQSKSQRTNAHGVDLNRNFPTLDWHRESREYWINRTQSDPRRFPGTAPLSEPESRWVVEEMERFRPHVIVSVHAPFGLLDFDGPPTTPPEQLGALYLTLLGTYPGSLGRFAGVQKRLPIITIELPLSGAMPNQTEVNTIWSDLVQWIRGHVHDKKVKPILKTKTVTQ